MGTFTFNEKTHRYYMDGKQMSGVTTILGVIAKPQLIAWSAGEVVEHIKKHAECPDGIYRVGNDTLEEARKAWAQKRDKSADAGTAVHTEIEELIKCRIGGIDWGSDNPQVNHFKAWADKHEVQFLASEEQVYSESLWVAGTYDFSCIIDGKKYLGDIKTGNALYPEYFYQCAAYRMMAEEMGQTDFAGSVLVRIGRDGTFNEDEDVVISYGYEEEKQAFLAALTLYRTTERYAKKREGSKAI